MARRKSGFKAWQRRWKKGWTAPDVPASRRRRNAWIDMLVFDDGVFRILWRNLHEFHEGVWRSSQPDPALIARLAARGCRAVLNLRGETLYGSYLLEREACAAHGLELVNVKFQSRQLPEVREVRQLDEIFHRIPHPFLIHCKSGADRSGFAAALYLLLKAGLPMAEARRQLSVRYLHFKRSKTGVLDFMLDAYEAAALRKPQSFRDWVYSEYDPDALMSQFHSGAAADFLVDHVLGRE
jgi:protein tyrosine/serine phosphatase